MEDLWFDKPTNKCGFQGGIYDNATLKKLGGSPDQIYLKDLVSKRLAVRQAAGETGLLEIDVFACSERI